MGCPHRIIIESFGSSFLACSSFAQLLFEMPFDGIEFSPFSVCLLNRLNVFTEYSTSLAPRLSLGNE